MCIDGSRINLFQLLSVDRICYNSLDISTRDCVQTRMNRLWYFGDTNVSYLGNPCISWQLARESGLLISDEMYKFPTERWNSLGNKCRYEFDTS